jgi:hypothetical protein
MVEIQEFGMGRTCGTHGGDKNCVQNFIETPEVKNHLAGISVIGRTVLKWILKGCGVRVWIGFIWRRIGSDFVNKKDDDTDEEDDVDYEG